MPVTDLHNPGGKVPEITKGWRGLKVRQRQGKTSINHAVILTGIRAKPGAVSVNDRSNALPNM
jgi:hypothetical protein